MLFKDQPTFTAAEVESHNTVASCYVTVGNHVYDVTDFLDAHPGGAGLILDYAGKDIADILKDEASHTHTEAAYEMLDESLVGFLADSTRSRLRNGKSTVEMNGKTNGDVIGQVNTRPDADAEGMVGEEKDDMIFENGRRVNVRTGMGSEEDLTKETDAQADYKKHKFLDLDRPLFPQVWFGGFSKDFYLEQVHRPRHYKGGKSAPIFGNMLEPFTKTAWWVVPLVWGPAVSYGVYLTRPGFRNFFDQALYFALGAGLWTLAEYSLHRFLFHLDQYLPDNRVGITLHFLLHGIHHYLPMDKYRLVMPPALFVVLATPIYYLAQIIFFWSWYVATTVFCGGVLGYICYDLTHYFLHHKNLPLWYRELKKYHLEHHFLNYENGFGVTSKFWDRVFGTEIVSK